MIQWINGEDSKTISVHGKMTVVGGFFNLYIEGTSNFVNLSREQLMQYIPDLGPKQRYCYANLFDFEVEYLFGKELAKAAIA